MNCPWSAYKRGILRTNFPIFASVSILHHCFFYLSIVSKHRSAPLSGGIMEKKIIYLKTLQFVLTLAFIWRLRSLHQFCGTFADPKAFLHDISIGHCESFTLIGKDSKSGEFGAVFDHHKWHNQLSMMSSTNGRPIEEQRHQFIDELAAKLPPAGRHCIPIRISPFYWFFEWVLRLYINPLNNGTLFHFSKLFSNALVSLVFLCIVIMEMLRSVEEYYSSAISLAFFSAIGWCFSVVHSFNLLFYWTDSWTCVNFQADHTNVPLVTLVLSIVLACSSVFEIVFKNSLFKKRPVNAPVVFEPQHHKLRKHYATCAIE